MKTALKFAEGIKTLKGGGEGNVCKTTDTFSRAASSSVFRFDSATHSYLLGERKLPSVTEIVMSVYGSSYIASEFHLNKGSMVHRAVALYLQGILDETTIDERIAGKLQAAKTAIKELGIKPALIETPMYHKILLYGGTLDVLPVDGILTDWKSGHSALATPPQLGGYAELLENNGMSVKKGREIVLSDTGSYKVYEYDIRHCRRLWMAGYTVFGHKQREG